MRVIHTNFKGLLVLKPNVFFDNRGSFCESWRLEDYKAYGIAETFIQDNVSVSKKNVLRGLHYQKNQGQLVCVVYGKIYEVAVDIRPESSTFKEYFSIEMSADNFYQLYMPPGFAHGFCVLSDVAVINYKCTQYYNTLEEGGILWRDPDINIKWPISDPTISDRDKTSLLLREIII